MRERVWAAANVHLDEVTVDTDTTVHTLFGNQMGGSKSYNPKNKGKKSYQPILSFIAETRKSYWGPTFFMPITMKAGDPGMSRMKAGSWRLDSQTCEIAPASRRLTAPLVGWLVYAK